MKITIVSLACWLKLINSYYLSLYKGRKSFLVHLNMVKHHFGVHYLNPVKHFIGYMYRFCFVCVCGNGGYRFEKGELYEDILESAGNICTY